MAASLHSLTGFMDGLDFTLLGGTPMVYHCHHYNLHHDQTIDDICGEDRGSLLRVEASREAWGHLLEDLAIRLGADTRAERLQLASELFSWMGQGRLGFQYEPAKGIAVGEFLHYATTWKQKYGSRVARHHPADAVAAGYAAAAFQLVEGVPAKANEVACAALKETRCRFDVEPAPEPPRMPGVGPEVFRSRSASAEPGLDEARIVAIAQGLRTFLQGVEGNSQGLIPAFGVFVTMNHPLYYARTAYDAVAFMEQESASHLGLAEDLLVESARVCAFNTFGGILRSEEWANLVGPLGGEFDVLSHCCSIARSLGFGHWSIHEHEPGKRLVVRAASNYEVPIYLERYGQSARPRCYTLQGAAAGMMLLASLEDLATRRELTHDDYLQLIRRKESAWKVEQTRCPTQGHALAEVVVTRA